MKKGLIFSIMIVLLCLTVLSLATFYSLMSDTRPITAEKTNSIFGDIQSDYEDIVGIRFVMEQNTTKRVVRVSDSFPNDTVTDTLDRYEGYIEDLYSTKVAANVSFYRGTPVFTFMPTEMVLDYPTYNKQAVRVYNISGNQDGLEQIRIMLFVDAPYHNLISDVDSGSFPVIVNASFQNGREDFEASLSKNGLTSLWFNLTGASVNVSFGEHDIGGLKQGSLMMQKSGDIVIDYEMELEFGTEQYLGVMSAAKVGVQNGMMREDWLWMSPQIQRDFNIPTTTTTIDIPTTTTTTLSITTTTSSTTSTSSSSTTTTTLAISCASHCTSLSAGYTGGNCRILPFFCGFFSQVYESSGNSYCTFILQPNCCCTPP